MDSASLVASSSDWIVARAYDGDATEAPVAAGSRRMVSAAAALTSAMSTPTARSSAPAIPSVCARRALSRCTGSTAGLPAEVADSMAAPIASWLRRVNFDASMIPSSVAATPANCGKSQGDTPVGSCTFPQFAEKGGGGSG